MSSYLITGVLQGIGYEFLRQLSSDPANIVIGITLNKDDTEKKVAADKDLEGRTNIHLLRADLCSFESLKKSVEDTAAIAGGKLDYLIANAAYTCTLDFYCSVYDLSRNNRLEFEKDVHRVVDVNLLGNIHLLTLYLPLLQRGQAKKAVVITSGLGDLDFTNLLRLDHQTVTSMAKAALNMIVAKFAAQSSRNHDGILYFAMSPGAVDTANVYFERATPEQREWQAQRWNDYHFVAPNHTGPMPVARSVQLMLDVLDKATIDNGYSGAFVSQYGNQQWL